MYLPNTVGKRHKNAFKFIFGDRNLRLRERAFVGCAPQHMVTEMTCNVNVRKIGSNFKRIDMRNCLNLSVTWKDFPGNKYDFAEF